MKLLTCLLILATPAIAAAADAHAAAGPESHAAAASPSPFAGTLAQSIAALLVFFIVFFVLKAKAWGPILKGLNEREGKIRADLEAAERARRDAQGSLESYKQQLAGAEAKVREMFASATKDAEAAATRIKMQAQQEAEEAKTRAVKEIEESRRNAILDVQAQAGNMATMIASKILKRSINEQDQADLVRSGLDELARR